MNALQDQGNAFLSVLNEELATMQDGYLEFESWGRILRAARKHGVPSCLQPALRRRYAWAMDARERGLSAKEAEEEFSAAVDRTAFDPSKYRMSMTKERPRRRRRQAGPSYEDEQADEAMDYAGERLG